jgi:hypothetical protein
MCPASPGLQGGGGAIIIAYYQSIRGRYLHFISLCNAGAIF